MIDFNRLFSKTKARSSSSIVNNFGLKPFGGKKDWDGDGVPNMFDCQPRNTMRQHFKKSTDTPISNYPDSYGYRGKLVYGKPQEFLNKTKLEHEHNLLNSKPFRYDEYKEVRDMNEEDYADRIIHKGGLTRITKGLKSKNPDVPIGWLETKKGIYTGHEGRHRAYAAKELGMKKIPWVEVETDKEHIEKEHLITDFEPDEKKAYINGASIEKQEEWQEKSDSEKITEKAVKNDTDGDGTPDEYDCEPENEKKQDKTEDIFNKLIKRKIKERIEYEREYRQRPEVKERQKEYRQIPKVKEKQREYYINNIEILKEKQKEYNQRPEVKEKKREYFQEYNQRPEVKEKRREYYQIPEVKEKRREYYQKYKKPIEIDLTKDENEHIESAPIEKQEEWQENINKDIEIDYKQEKKEENEDDDKESGSEKTD